jgi:hypothetical protein
LIAPVDPPTILAAKFEFVIKTAKALGDWFPNCPQTR